MVGHDGLSVRERFATQINGWEISLGAVKRCQSKEVLEHLSPSCVRWLVN